MAPLEPWEKALVDAATFMPTVHGEMACTDCHAGDALTSDKETAHAGLIGRPSSDAETTCGDCHPDVVAMEENSLHANLTGYWTVLDQRSVPENHDQLSTMFGNHCYRCHTTCGDCHVSQPFSAGGGLVDGHVFNAEPSMTQNCTACHGSRVGNEYLGKNEGYKADVHFRQGRMVCTDCHTGHEMHGQPAQCTECHTGPEAMSIPPADHRYDSVQSPRCETCHVTATTGQDGIEMHAEHGGDLSCQVCHSITYTSCDGCHVAISEKSGNPFFETEATYMTFYIGRNPLKSYDRPYEFVPVRHVPIAQTSFEFYGANLLPNFDALPNWAYTTPHNIQRETPQAASCNSCHGVADLFLTADKVAEDELNANAGVIIESVPLPVGDITTTITTTVPITDTGNLVAPTPEP